MNKQIIVNSSAIETRVALVENNSLAELHIESASDRSVAGHVFKGKVLRVLPGMQAAFVDIGLEKAAFMHVADFWHPPPTDQGAGSDGQSFAETDTAPPAPDTDDFELAIQQAAADLASNQDVELDDESLDAELEDEGQEEPPQAPKGQHQSSRAEHSDRPPIEKLLKKGQEIVVQVSKEPIGTKGARITSHISLPGRFAVYTPTSNHIGVSRRIEDEKERKRLREIVASGRHTDQGGYIVRTACEGVSKKELQADMSFLGRLWDKILDKSERSPAPSLLNEDLDLVLRSIRDLFTQEVKRVVVDDANDHARIIEFMDGVLQPKLKSRVELYEEIEPIFDRHGLETAARRAIERRVWLKSGGYLIIDPTEALTTIDVNTGRFVGKKTHEETVLKTNLEAAQVAIDQLRLRNIGGIIIIDFIDMELAENRKKVSAAISEAVKRDKARTNILRISELGLVQMTRKRTRDSLRQLITTPCPACDGDGRRRSIEALAAAVTRDIRRQVAASPNASSVRVKLSSELAEAMRKKFQKGLDEIRSSLGVSVELRSDRDRSREEWEIHLNANSEAEPEAKLEG